jgi:hypothetical protein
MSYILLKHIVLTFTVLLPRKIGRYVIKTAFGMSVV